MKNILLQLLFLILVFFSTWFLLSRINWESILKIKHLTNKTEAKLGDMIWTMIQETETEITNSTIDDSLDSLLNRICIKNNIDRASIKLHIIKKNEINAFALPNNHLVVYSSLIENCENEAELCGVLCHEIAHMQENHIMKKLSKEVGLSVLISITTGNGNSKIAQEVLKLLSSSAFDRKLEKEADLKAVSYLLNAEIDPEPFANFLYRLSKKESNTPQQLTWISTHPESKERAKYILESIKNSHILRKPILQKVTWELLQRKLKGIE